MAMFTCPDCKTRVSLSADKCPVCGRPVTAADKPSSGFLHGFVNGLKLALKVFVILCIISVVVNYAMPDTEEKSQPTTNSTDSDKPRKKSALKRMIDQKSSIEEYINTKKEETAKHEPVSVSNEISTFMVKVIIPEVKRQHLRYYNMEPVSESTTKWLASSDKDGYVVVVTFKGAVHPKTARQISQMISGKIRMLVGGNPFTKVTIAGTDGTYGSFIWRPTDTLGRWSADGK